jgi:hypothetical protein
VDRPVTSEEVLAILNKLSTEKAARPDSISNEVLKRIASKIASSLTHDIRTAFVYKSLSKRYKESITIVLRKEGKKDYSLLRSYRPIVLENTLAKIIKKMLTTRLSNAIKEHGLLS